MTSLRFIRKDPAGENKKARHCLAFLMSFAQRRYYSAVGTSEASLISGRSTSSTKAIGALSP